MNGENRLAYWPNPAHKRTTTEAGPPQWSPDKERCPDDLTVAERTTLLEGSVPEEEANPRSRRFAIRFVRDRLEFFEAKYTQTLPDGALEFHGHPTARVPSQVLRRFVTKGLITLAQYRRLLRELTCD